MPKSKPKSRQTVPIVPENDYQVVKYDPRFKDQVLQLQFHHWGKNQALNKAYLEWKYEQNPYMDKVHIYLALHSGKVVGMRGFFGTRWHAGNPRKTFVVPTAGDTVINPLHRNKGIYALLTNKAQVDLYKAGYTYAFNLSAGPTCFISSQMMGWRSLGCLNQLQYESAKSATHPWLRRLTKRYPLLSFVAPKKPFAHLVKNRKRLDSRVILTRSPRSKSMADLVHRVYQQEKIQQDKDHAFFKWRFGNPFAEYRFLFWENTGGGIGKQSGHVEIEGYLVLHASPYRKKYHTSIVDWAFSSSQVEADLLKTVIALGKLDGFVVWSAALSEKSQVLLKDFGFLKDKRFEGLKRHLPTILIKNLQQDEGKDEYTLAGLDISDLVNWDLRMIDSDSY